MPEFSADNRALIPVRFIPFVTGWKLSPDTVVKILAKSDKWNRVFIPSFHLSADNTYHPMQPKEWDVFDDDMKILSDTLHAGDSVEGESYPVCRKRSIEHKIEQLWKDRKYIVWGMPFYNETETKVDFEKEVNAQIL